MTKAVTICIKNTPVTMTAADIMREREPGFRWFEAFVARAACSRVKRQADEILALTWDITRTIALRQDALHAWAAQPVVCISSPAMKAKVGGSPAQPVVGIYSPAVKGKVGGSPAQPVECISSSAALERISPPAVASERVGPTLESISPPAVVSESVVQ